MLTKLNHTVWDYYEKCQRDFPWRTDNKTDHLMEPYHIVISEIMLQQTQAPRVIPKYLSFIKKFPDFETLAKAPLSAVLAEWQGLGYNRRGMYLKQLAESVHKNGLPKTREGLEELPGIGPNTAGSILAFAFNMPIPFIETNIRSVFIHFFFQNSKKKVTDKELMPLIEKALKIKRNQENPREWYYALMDYGVHLKATRPNPSRKSKHHVKQSTFKGSNRELRAKILRSILQSPKTASELEKEFSVEFKNKGKKNTRQKTIDENLIALANEGFIKKTSRKGLPGLYSIL